jgi:hypothetical protein
MTFLSSRVIGRAGAAGAPAMLDVIEAEGIAGAPQRLGQGEDVRDLGRYRRRRLGQSCGAKPRPNVGQ